MHPLLRTGIGIVLAITLYNTFRIRFSPSLPCETDKRPAAVCSGPLDC